MPLIGYARVSTEDQTPRPQSQALKSAGCAEIHEEQAAGIRGADLVKIPDCGHLATIEQPEAVSAALRGWLIAVAAGGRASG